MVQPLDEADATPLRFWTLLADTIGRLDGHAAQHMASLIHTARPLPVEQMLPMLVDALARCQEHVVVVLDDDHTIRSDAIHANRARRIDHAPPNAHWTTPTHHHIITSSSARRGGRGGRAHRASRGRGRQPTGAFAAAPLPYVDAIAR